MQNPPRGTPWKAGSVSAYVIDEIKRLIRLNQAGSDGYFRVLPTPTQSRLDFALQRRVRRLELLSRVVIRSAPHLRAKNVREPRRSDAALGHRNKREATFHIALCGERRISRLSARRCSRRQRRRLLQLHKQQNKNRPHPHGHRKLRQGRVAHRTSSGKRKRQKEHNQCREYPDHQLAFPVHERFPLDLRRRPHRPTGPATRQRKSIPRRGQVHRRIGRLSWRIQHKQGRGGTRFSF